MSQPSAHGFAPPFRAEIFPIKANDRLAVNSLQAFKNQSVISDFGRSRQLTLFALTRAATVC
jgi:hypothetical protein